MRQINNLLHRWEAVRHFLRNDLALFVKKRELITVKELLKMFWEASGLKVN
jgi:hypothetical protein